MRQGMRVGREREATDRFRCGCMCARALAGMATARTQRTFDIHPHHPFMPVPWPPRVKPAERILDAAHAGAGVLIPEWGDFFRARPHGPRLHRVGIIDKQIDPHEVPPSETAAGLKRFLSLSTSPSTLAASQHWRPPLPLILIVLLVLLLAGGGGFYWGGPTVGGSTVGLILLIVIILALTGGFRRRG